MFIKLTDVKIEKCIVNGKRYHVIETPEEIMELINGK